MSDDFYKHPILNSPYAYTSRVEAAREAADAGFDVLAGRAFNFEARATESSKRGRIPVLKARPNADLHVAGEPKNAGEGNVFAVLDEPRTHVVEQADERIRVKVNGVDALHPQTGEVRDDGPVRTACWSIDTDYDAESPSGRHAYLLAANDPRTRRPERC